MQTPKPRKDNDMSDNSQSVRSEAVEFNPDDHGTCDCGAKATSDHDTYACGTFWGEPGVPVYSQQCLTTQLRKSRKDTRETKLEHDQWRQKSIDWKDQYVAMLADYEIKGQLNSELKEELATVTAERDQAVKYAESLTKWAGDCPILPTSMDDHIKPLGEPQPAIKDSLIAQPEDAGKGGQGEPTRCVTCGEIREWNMAWPIGEEQPEGAKMLPCRDCVRLDEPADTAQAGNGGGE